MTFTFSVDAYFICKLFGPVKFQYSCLLPTFCIVQFKSEIKLICCNF